MDESNKESNPEDECVGMTRVEKSDLTLEDGKDQEMVPLVSNDAPLLDVVDEWAQGTSIHGVAFVTDRQTFAWWKRMIWACLICASFGLMTTQIYTLIKEYRDYDVKNDMYSVFEGSIKFPQVTICNMNKFSKAAQAEHGILEPRNKQEFEMLTQPFEDFVWLTSFNEAVIDDLASVWTPVLTVHGLCYQFRTEKEVYVPGLDGGLYFWANINQSNYQPSQSEAGLILFVTQKGWRITNQDPFVTLKTGKVSLLTLDARTFYREKKLPWSRCQGNAPEYTNGKCVEDCVNEAVRTTCGCKFPHDPIDPEMEFCTLSDWTNGTCSHFIGLRHENSYANCTCDMPPCFEERYTVATNEADYSEPFLSAFEAEYEWSADDFVQNFISAHVNFASLAHEVSRESKAVTSAQLLASVGGSMGLFLGISFLSVVELVGDLCMLRMIPRLFGIRDRHGFGARRSTGN